MAKKKKETVTIPKEEYIQLLELKELCLRVSEVEKKYKKLVENKKLGISFLLDFMLEKDPIKKMVMIEVLYNKEFGQNRR